MPSGPISLRQVQLVHERFLVAHSDMVDDVLQASGEFAQDHVRAHSNFKRRSVAPNSLKDKTEFRVVRTSSGHTLRVKSNKKTASFLDKGTKDHGPKTARVLAFRGRNGQMVFTKKVKGIKPRRFLWKATFASYRVSRHGLTEGMRKVAAQF